MRLTLALLKKRMPNGNIWIGKHRLAHHFYPNNIQQMVRRLQVEDMNMLLLRHPYLTVEQEKSYDRVPEKKIDVVAIEKFEHVAARLHRSVRMEDKFDNLLSTNSWDPGRG